MERKQTTVVYQAEPSGRPAVNPHKGYVMTVHDPYAFSPDNPLGIGGAMHNHAWDVVRICSGSPFWKNLNPAEGVYTWDSIDAILDVCGKIGMTYGIRAMPYSTAVGPHDNFGRAHDFVPDYVYEKGAKHTDAVLKSDRSIHIRVPDWSDPVYLAACKDFAKAMAEKYDDDPRVEFVDIRPFGNWGEWHNSQYVGSEMPSEEIQMDMLDYYASVFKKTTLALPSDAEGAVYRHALSVGITKRDDGMIEIPYRERDLLPAYEANLPTIAENYAPYVMMLRVPDNNPAGYHKWTPERFRRVIEGGHLSIFALDQSSDNSYRFYAEQKDVIDEMVNRMGYNFTVTSAVREQNRLEITVRNTGLAPCFFNIDLCAEITDEKGNKKESFGRPVRIEKGTFRDETEKTFVFEHDGALSESAVLCLSMYESDNQLVAGKDPTVKFDNKNTLPNNRLLLVRA